MNDDDSDSTKRATAAAIRFISYRPRTEAEVRARLRRHYPPQIIDTVVQSLVDRSLIDDSRYAQSWADSRYRLKPRSAVAIRRELATKGITRAQAEEAVRDLDDYNSAYRAGSKHARLLTGHAFTTFKRRMWAYLQRRGFNSNVTRTTVECLWKESHTGDEA